ncbi:MAG: hypothetical protein A2086_03580 [Spirochaetes bacterium GWD1_27_9]|nr:MAG: hypothetical protein A2Z98_09450 [Spirochaetes bacterium GWB1_27_13]OHD31136.1 MAG: hypothetical protein A2086_03580 [Spirochaetes bacterium GWD1_27_9]
MIKVLIADDEKHCRERLKILLSKYDFFSLECEAKNGEEVLQQIIAKKPDVAFLDINMPGVSVFNSIPSIKNPPIIIFQTAYSQYAVDAFGIDAIDYLLKPISEDRFCQTVEKIKNYLKIKESIPQEENYNEELKSISVKNGDLIKVIPITQIINISFEDGFSFVYTSEGRFFSDKYLNYFEEKLVNHDFFRVSRNDLINLAYISSLHKMFHNSYIVELKNKKKIDVSRRKAFQLKKIIGLC